MIRHGSLATLREMPDNHAAMGRVDLVWTSQLPAADVPALLAEVERLRECLRVATE